MPTTTTTTATSAAHMKLVQHYELDLAHDTLGSGRTFHVMTILDVQSRECIGVDAGTSLLLGLGIRTVHLLAKLGGTHGLPTDIRAHPDCITPELQTWCERRRIPLHSIESGKGFTAHLTAECLNENWWPTVTAARNGIEKWINDYNELVLLLAQRSVKPARHAVSTVN